MLTGLADSARSAPLYLNFLDFWKEIIRIVLDYSLCELLRSLHL